MKKLDAIVRTNYSEKKAISAKTLDELMGKIDGGEYRACCKKLLEETSKFAALDYSGKEYRKLDSFYAAYNFFLAYFDTKKMNAGQRDFEALKGFASGMRKGKIDEGKTFHAVSPDTFRKNLENFAADRIAERVVSGYTKPSGKKSAATTKKAATK